MFQHWMLTFWLSAWWTDLLLVQLQWPLQQSDGLLPPFLHPPDDSDIHDDGDSSMETGDIISDENMSLSVICDRNILLH